MTVPQESFQRALAIILDRRNHPILIHCNKGKHRTGCLVACLRKVQGRSLTSILEEYRRFTGKKHRYGCTQRDRSVLVADGQCPFPMHAQTARHAVHRVVSACTGPANGGSGLLTVLVSVSVCLLNPHAHGHTHARRYHDRTERVCCGTTLHGLHATAASSEHGSEKTWQTLSLADVLLAEVHRRVRTPAKRCRAHLTLAKGHRP